MKKTLIALAALASTAVFAQSSVSLTGRIDLGHANIKTTDLDSGVATKGTSLAGDQHGRTTSRLTFSGTEDLGGGLKASFNYETRISPDNTSTPGMDRTRLMFLNLTGGFGQVQIGTYLNSIDTVRGFSAATYSAPGGDFLSNHVGIAGNGLGGRSTNAIAYGTRIGNVSASLGVSSEKTSTGAVVNNQRGFIGSVAYAGGPLSARIAFGQGRSDVDLTGAALDAGKSTDLALGASYDLGMAVPYIIHEQTKAQVSSVGGAPVSVTPLKTTATEIGATFPLGALTPYVVVGVGKLDFGTSENKTRAFQVGTTYALSKRTSVYGAAGQFKVADIVKSNGYKIGLIHNF